MDILRKRYALFSTFFTTAKFRSVFEPCESARRCSAAPMDHPKGKMNAPGVGDASLRLYAVALGVFVEDEADLVLGVEPILAEVLKLLVRVVPNCAANSPATATVFPTLDPSSLRPTPSPAPHRTQCGDDGEVAAEEA